MNGFSNILSVVKKRLRKVEEGFEFVFKKEETHAQWKKIWNGRSIGACGNEMLF